MRKTNKVTLFELVPKDAVSLESGSPPTPYSFDYIMTDWQLT